MELSSPIPRNWKQFLCLNDNKTELFKLLNSELVASATLEKTLVVSNGDTAICSPAQDISNLAPCNHEEADSRIMVHVADAIKQGFQKILVRTVDTDIVVLAVAVLPQLGRAELWIDFGTGNNLRYIPAHEICASLGPQKSLTLPVFHAFTACDTVSHFAKVGEKSAWKVWATHVTNSLPSSTIHHSKYISEETEAALDISPLYFSMTSTGHEHVPQLMKLASFFSHTKDVRCHFFLPPRLLCSITLEEPSCKVDISGLLLWYHIVKYHFLLTGVGPVQNSGRPCGHVCQRLVCPVQSC